MIMKQKIRRLFKEERGNIMVLFAGSLIVIIAFIGLSLDVGLLSLERNSLQNLSQVIREDRFTNQDKIRYADNPGLASYNIISETLAENGFDGTVTVYFYEKEPKASHREYYIRTVLSEEFSWNFARVVGMTTTPISVTLDGYETCGENGLDVVWFPKNPPSSYNGSYSSGGFVAGDIPPEWISP
jgi:hypothetical protein